MIIVVTATGPSMDDGVEARFGRAPYYIFIDMDSMKFEAVQNPNMSAGGGAGIQSAQLMANRGVRYVLTGNCGPNAFNVFGAAGIQVVSGVSGTVRQAVEQFKTGSISPMGGPSVESHFGMGTGGGRSMSMGGGQGMGMGGGRGMGMGGGRGMGMGGGRGMGMGGASGWGMSDNRGREASDERASRPDAGLNKRQSGHGEGTESILSEEESRLIQQRRDLEQQLKATQEQIDRIKGGAKSVIAHIDSRVCTRCGLCVDACPEGAITLNESAVVDARLCNACGACLDICPVDAITLM